MRQNGTCSFHPSRQLLWACCGSLWSLTCTAHAADSNLTYPEILVDDVKHVITAPSHWQMQEWQNLGWAALAVAGTAAVADRPIRDAMRRQSGNSRFMRDIERFGAEYSAGMLGGFFLAGAVGNNGKAMAVAQDGLAASLIASGMVTPVIKYATGRSRPRDNAGITHFKPFSGDASFPSGHATQAFTVASVISAHYDDTWVKCSSYTLAGLVGVARSYHDAHFASDVLAGALVGTAVGQSVVAYSQPRRTKKMVLLPETMSGLVGMRITGSF